MFAALTLVNHVFAVIFPRFDERTVDSIGWPPVAQSAKLFCKVEHAVSIYACVTHY